MKLKLPILAVLFLAVASAGTAGEATAFVDTPVGQTAAGKAWLIFLSTQDGKIEYGLLASTADGTWHMLPALLDTRLPEGAIGKPCIISATVTKAPSRATGTELKVKTVELLPVGDLNLPPFPRGVASPAEKELNDSVTMAKWRGRKVTLGDAEIMLELVLSGRPTPPDWGAFKKLMKTGDELWTFCAPQTSWEKPAKYQGFAIFRGDALVKAYVTMRILEWPVRETEGDVEPTNAPYSSPASRVQKR
jgi:hypothetical protein